MTKLLAFLLIIGLVSSCRSTRKIQSAITKKDSTALVNTSDTLELKRSDSLKMIQSILQKVAANKIDFKTFNAKVNVDYSSGDGKNYDLSANIRMYKDSIIWINVNALLGIDVMRMIITKDSVKLLNKQEKIYTARSVNYLQEVTALPLDLKSVQDLIIGNPVFLDSNIVSYSINKDEIAMLSFGEWFKTLIILSQPEADVVSIKLDDVDIVRNRSADLTYKDYENKPGFPFSSKRKITVEEKKKLEIKLDFKQYDFNGDVSFPFSIPKNYDRN